MESFFALYYAMGISTMFFDDWSENFDILGSLPEEVAVMILRKLDPKSLVNAIQVSSKWLGIVKSDRILRQTVREEFARRRQEQMNKGMLMSRLIAKARAEILPCPDAKRRKFEKSVKTVDKMDKPKSKKRSWVSSISTSQLKKMR